MRKNLRGFGWVSVFVSAATALIGCGEVPVSAVGAEASGSSTGTGDSGGGAGVTSGAPSAENEIFRRLTGRFDSEAQAQNDKAFYAVQLQTCVVSAPELGERVLYVEQAMMTKLDAPYRQRLYVIEPVSGSTTKVTSGVFELVAPKAAVHLCDAETMATFSSTDVELREGCSVHLEWNHETATFNGGTEGTACASTLNGASYATSEVIVRADGLSSWDRGFDAEGDQVWGAVKGGYEFVRRTPLPE